MKQLFKKTVTQIKKIALPAVLVLVLVFSSLLILTGCREDSSPNPQQEASPAGGETPDGESSGGEPVTILVAAAASLENSLRDELIPLFQETYPHITVEGTYDSSGKLQQQIEEGLPADVFLSASPTQMNTLIDKELIIGNSVVDLLENQIVLIVPAGSAQEVASFTDLNLVGFIALGDPDSVPAGQYAKEALSNLGIYDQLLPQVSFGTNVTEVLNWVAEGSADAGIVYATDAATTDSVTIVTQAPEGSLAQKVIYPVGILACTENQPQAQLFVDFLQSDEALQIFRNYGFSPNK